MLPLQTVLELVSDEIWRVQISTQKSETGTDIPSFRERQQIVAAMQPKATFDGTTISFDAEYSTLTSVPFFNYLLLKDDAVFTDYPDGTSRITDDSWSIIGFSSFKELENYIQRAKFMCFSVYVRYGDYYQKAQYRFAIQRPGEKKMYVNDWGFYYPDADLNGRNPTYQYYFEIIGLCEIQCGKDISCCLIHSLDDLVDELEGRACITEAHCRGTLGYPFLENGTIRYDGSEYTFQIEISKNATMWNFFDAASNPYCLDRHAFCTPDAKCCDESKCSITTRLE